MRQLYRFLKNTKAVSPIIASLLLIVIVVAAGAMLFTFMSGMVPAVTGQPRPPAHSLTFDGAIKWNIEPNTAGSTASYGSVVFIVSNMGIENVTIKNIQLVTSDGALISLADTASSETDSAIDAESFAVQAQKPPKSSSTAAQFTDGNNTLQAGTNYVLVTFPPAEIPPLKSATAGFETGRSYNFIILTTDNFKIPFIARSS